MEFVSIPRLICSNRSMPVPILSVAQMREWEQATWASGQTEAAVIARVGEGLARRAMAMTRPGDSILILGGRGHNGDDARAMTPHLPERDVRTVLVTDPLAAFARVNEALLTRPALLVDGLFGIGLNRELDAGWRALMARVNEAQVPVLAVDVPSGLDAGSGRALPLAIRATVTMTVGAPKAGLLAAEAGEFVGRLEVADDVGLVPCPITGECQWVSADEPGNFPPLRPVTAHKGTFGHAGLVAGSLGCHGAAVLAARGAQRARPGLITLFPQPEVYTPVAAQLQSVMVHPWRDHFDSTKFSALLFGPGLAAPDLPRTVRHALRAAWQRFQGPLVVDASALDWIEPEVPADAGRIITPHPGEAARLLGSTTVAVQRDRLAALRELSRRFSGCWVVLKGQHTLTGRDSGNVFVNGSGNAGLAQGGSGDLLAGFITGWLAQPMLQSDVAAALRHAVCEHGAAADRLAARRSNWTIEDLAGELGR